MITLIGLGPADAGHLSVAARDALRAATRLLVRTRRHPAVDDLDRERVVFEALDGIYESAPDFDSVYTAISERVLAEAARGDVALAVPGHPLMGEESVRRVLAAARERGIPTRVVGSECFVEPVLAALGLSIGDGLLIVDALSIERMEPRPGVPVLLYQVYDARVASDVKLALMRHYPDDWPVRVVGRAGVTGEETVADVALHRLDRIEADHLTAVYVPPVPAAQRKPAFGDLVAVMARLRAEGGCPWDREQDHRTLRKYLIEECYEAVDAIDADDMDGLAEELGDVLLQVVFHAQIEAEAGLFDIDDVVGHIVRKLVRRHPHVFGDVTVDDSSQVVDNWEKIKRDEKGEGWRESVLDGVPSSLPALSRALEISKRAAKVGFEWERFEDVLAKMEEEILELREAIGTGQADRVFDEVGDLLFTIVNVARWRKIDPEEALRQMLVRFRTRFRRIEQAAKEQSRDLSDLGLAEMDALWEQAKRET